MPTLSPKNKKIMRYLGLGLIGVGAFYLLTNNSKSKTGCRLFDGREKACDSASNCYYWSDNTCRGAEEGYAPCSELGGVGSGCSTDDYCVCDRVSNKCCCETGRLVSYPNNEDCIYGNSYLKCYEGDLNYTCQLTVGVGEDECLGGAGFLCPCKDGNCQYPGFCGRNNICYPVGMKSININSSDWHNQHHSTWCGGGDGGHTRDYTLPEPHTVQVVQGTVWIEWQFPWTLQWLRIYGHLEGEGWKFLGETSWHAQDNNHDISIVGEKQAMDKIRFSMCGGGNTRVTRFYGNLQ